ncbi:MAG: hypothetical protein ACPG8W_21545, partial [Candidatus Promineifilaceae bacterium]
LANVYVRGDSLAEFWAMAFYPIVLLTAERLLRHASFSAEKVLPLALSYAALVLSHNISALIFTPFLGGYILYRAFFNRSWSNNDRLLRLRNALIAGILGLILAAWFWMPALAEQDFVQLGPVTEGYFHYAGHFLSDMLIQPQWRFNYDVTQAQNPFRMGLVQSLLIGASVLLTLIQQGATSKAKQQTLSASKADTGPSILLITLLLLGLATFMLLPQSTWLWEHLPLLAFTQFPWRFLSVQALFGALLIGRLVPSEARAELVISSGLALLMVWSAFAGLRVDFLGLADEDISAESLAQYEWFTGNIGTTISAEYLPLAVQPRPWTSNWLHTGTRHAVTVIDGEAQAKAVQTRTHRQLWQIDVATEQATVVFPLLFFDGWQASLEPSGTALSLSASDGAGLAQLSLPAGSHSVALAFRLTPVRFWAEALSAVGAVVALLFGWQLLLQRWRVWLGVGVLILGTGAILQFRPNPPPTPAIQSWDFAQLGYLHRDEAISFTNGATLLEAAFDTTDVTTGDVLRLKTRWSQESTGVVTLILTTPAKPRETENRPIFPLSQQSATIQNGVANFELTIPSDMPTGLIMPRLTFDDGYAQTGSELRRSELYLQPVQILPSTLTAADPDQIEAQVMAVQWLEQGDLLLKARWATDAPLSENYQASWRVYDRFGRFFAELDTQPGYGYLPTTAWPVNQWVNDWVQLHWLADDGEGIFTIVAALRDADGETVYQQRVAQVRLGENELLDTALHSSTALPPNAATTAINFADQITLNGYQLTTSEAEAVVTLYWEAQTDDLAAYRHFVHLVNTDSGDVVTQHDTEPRFGTYPTDRWQRGKLVDDLAVLFLHDVPSGVYEIRVGLYQNLGDQFPRLSATDASGSPLQDSIFTLPETITIP